MKLVFLKINHLMVDLENFRYESEKEESFARKNVTIGLFNSTFGLLWFVFIRRSYDRAAFLLIVLTIVEAIA